MTKRGFSEVQIIATLQEQEFGTTATDRSGNQRQVLMQRLDAIRYLSAQPRSRVPFNSTSAPLLAIFVMRQVGLSAKLIF
jgi:hypothetical protein